MAAKHETPQEPEGSAVDRTSAIEDGGPLTSPHDVLKVETTASFLGGDVGVQISGGEKLAPLGVTMCGATVGALLWAFMDNAGAGLTLILVALVLYLLARRP